MYVYNHVLPVSDSRNDKTFLYIFIARFNLPALKYVVPFSLNNLDCSILSSASNDQLSLDCNTELLSQYIIILYIAIK